MISCSGDRRLGKEQVLYRYPDRTKPCFSRRLCPEELNRVIHLPTASHKIERRGMANKRLTDWVRLGVCPTLTVLLRRTMCDHLRRSRPEKILNVFQRIRFRFFQACGLASGHTSFASSRRQCRTGSWIVQQKRRSILFTASCRLMPDRNDTDGWMKEVMQTGWDRLPGRHEIASHDRGRD